MTKLDRVLKIIIITLLASLFFPIGDNEAYYDFVWILSAIYFVFRDMITIEEKKKMETTVHNSVKFMKKLDMALKLIVTTLLISLFFPIGDNEVYDRFVWIVTVIYLVFNLVMIIKQNKKVDTTVHK